jgi:hypothetical protein
MEYHEYDSSSPELFYDSDLLFYDLPLPVRKKVMARIKLGLDGRPLLGILQYLQNLITAATGNPNATTPSPSLVVLQGLYDDGVAAVNAVEAAEDTLATKRAERDAQFELIRSNILSFALYCENVCGGDAAKLQSLGWDLRAPSTPAQPCSTVMGLVTSVGDSEGEMAAGWDGDPEAGWYEVATSPDPITSSSWTSVQTVGGTEVTLTGLPSGAKRWVRVRAINRLGPGPWSDPSCRMIP